MSRSTPRSPARARLNALAQLGLLAVAAWCSIATSQVPTCYFGTSPFDGATNVSINTSITFKSNVLLPRDLPAISTEAARLVRLPDNWLVPVDYELDPEARTIRLTPKEPLEAGREYEAYGFDMEALESSNYLTDAGSMTPVTIRFRTASAPRGLALFHTSQESIDGTRRYVVVFSEAIDLDSIDGQNVVFYSGSEPLTSILIGRYQDQPHLLEFSVAAPASDDGTEESPTPVLIADQVALGTTLRGSSGVALDGDGDGSPGELEDTQQLPLVASSVNGYVYPGDPVLEKYLGEAWCEE